MLLAAFAVKRLILFFNDKIIYWTISEEVLKVAKKNCLDHKFDIDASFLKWWVSPGVQKRIGYKRLHREDIHRINECHYSVQEARFALGQHGHIVWTFLTLYSVTLACFMGTASAVELIFHVLPTPHSLPIPILSFWKPTTFTVHIIGSLMSWLQQKTWFRSVQVLEYSSLRQEWCEFLIIYCHIKACLWFSFFHCIQSLLTLVTSA